jgi:hypothetical protein
MLGAKKVVGNALGIEGHGPIVQVAVNAAVRQILLGLFAAGQGRIRIVAFAVEVREADQDGGTVCAPSTTE